MKSYENAIFFPSTGTCLGIDPSVNDFDGGSHIARMEFESKLEVHCRVIERLEHHYVLKPNLGFFLRFGSWGIGLLENFCHRFRSDHSVLLDGKFGEISTTLEAYLDFAFHNLGVHGITLNPYLGEDTIRQALVHCNESTAGFGRVYVLCATSQFGQSSGLGKIQAIEEIIGYCSKLHEEFGNSQAHCPIGLVVGAGRKDVFQREDLRRSRLPLLCPGLGAQGALFDDAALLSEKLGFPNPCLFPLSRYVFEGGNASVELATERIQKVKNLLSPSQTSHSWSEKPKQ